MIGVSASFSQGGGCAVNMVEESSKQTDIALYLVHLPVVVGSIQEAGPASLLGLR